jgi:hypothetical protein
METLQTGQYMREQQPLLKKIKLLLLFNPLTTWLDTTHAMRLYMHNSAIKEGTAYPVLLYLHLQTISMAN